MEGRGLGAIPTGTRVGVLCKELGQTIPGPWTADAFWDKVTYRGITGVVPDEWVATKQDENDPTKIPECPLTAADLVAPAGPSGVLYAVIQDVIVRDGAQEVAHAISSIPAGTWVGVRCKTVGQTVMGPWGGDPYWDKISYAGKTGFVSDEWVDTKQDEKNPGKIPNC
jgi:hypothetical protein